MKEIKNTNLRILLTFLPLLVLYIFVVIFFRRDFINADELRYITYARNLVNGNYAPEGDIWNGPGYPFVLYPFELFKISVAVPIFLNTFFLYFSVFFLCKSLIYFTDYKKAMISSYIFGLYYPFFKPLILAMTEMTTILLICVIQYLIISYYRKEKFKRWHLVGSAFFLAYLAMVKIIFGYVILACLIFLSIIYLFQKINKKRFLGFVKIFALGLLFCTPYLAYTHSITGEFFYWGRPGNDAFYWMTTPFDNEYGDYYVNAPMDPKVWKNQEFSLYPEQFITNHKKVMDQISVLPPLQADSVWYTEAINNIKARPTKYLINCFANLGRILFSYPHSYRNMNLVPYYYLIPNMFLLVFFILLLYPAIRYFRRIPVEIRIFMLFILIYLGASTLVSADFRMIFPLIPTLAIYLAYMLLRMMKISITPKSENSF